MTVNDQVNKKTTRKIKSMNQKYATTKTINPAVGGRGLLSERIL
jgi:hypothetical protein